MYLRGLVHRGADLMCVNMFIFEDFNATWPVRSYTFSLSTLILLHIATLRIAAANSRINV